MAVLITIPIGSFDALTAWILKPYMDVVLVEKNVQAVSFMPLLPFLCIEPHPPEHCLEHGQPMHPLPRFFDLIR